MHEIDGKKVEVVDTETTFEQIYKKEYIPAEYIEDIKKANILIIPNENFREEGDKLFPETTREFFEFLKDESGEKIITDIAIADEDFQRIELHSAAIEVATIIVQSAIFNIAIGLITNFLYDLVKNTIENQRKQQRKLRLFPKKLKLRKVR